MTTKKTVSKKAPTAVPLTKEQLFYKSMLGFQAILEDLVIIKSKVMEYGKFDKKTKFPYADLSDILRATRGALTQNDLVLSFPMEPLEGNPSVVKISAKVTHMDGYWDEVSACFKAASDPKDFGKSCTYYKRYLVNSLFALDSGEPDTDGNEEGEVRSNLKTPSPEESESKEDTGEYLRSIFIQKYNKLVGLCRTQNKNINDVLGQEVLFGEQSLSYYKDIEEILNKALLDMGKE